MTDRRMRRVKLPIEVIAMVLSELTHAEAWRLRILSSAVNDWVLNVLVKRALQSAALVARAPGSFIFYEPPSSVHGLRFSFLQKHGAHAIFQAKSTEWREIEDFKKKPMLQVVVHLDNNHDPLIIRHLKLRDLSLDRDSVTLQCNWRNLFVAAFNMSPQQRSDQALATSPLYVWQPAKVDGMPGKWKKGITWLYSDSQVSSASQRSTSTTSSSQHMYGLVAYDSASGTTNTTSASQSSRSQSHQSNSANLTQVTNATASSLNLSSQLSQIGDVPQSSPPRNANANSNISMLHSISAYPDSSVSSGPSRPPEVAEGGSGSSVLKTLGLDGAKLNPAPPIEEHEPDPAPAEPEITRFSSTRDRFTPAAEDREREMVASSPMSDSLFSATIRPALRGGESSPLAGVLEEEGEDAGDISWMLASERDVSCMIVNEGESHLSDEEDEEIAEEDGAEQSESQGTTLAGTASEGVLSRTHSAMTGSTDVEFGSQGEGKEKALGMRPSQEDIVVGRTGLGAARSLPLVSQPVGEGDVVHRMSLSPQVMRRTRSAIVAVGPTSSVDCPPSDAEEP